MVNSIRILGFDKKKGGGGGGGGGGCLWLETENKVK